MAPLHSPLCRTCESKLGASAHIKGRCGREHPSVAIRDCVACRRSRLHFDKSLSLGVYEAELERVVTGLKFAALPRIARPLGRLLAQIGTRLGFYAPGTILVPVPLSRRRLRNRGYNQAELIARRIAATTGLVMRPRWLRRVRDTRPQSDLSARQRRQNVLGAFASAEAVSIPGARVVLVDDVLTTGATVNDCARALLQAGASRVDVVTVARAARAG